MLEQLAELLDVIEHAKITEAAIVMLELKLALIEAMMDGASLDELKVIIANKCSEFGDEPVRVPE